MQRTLLSTIANPIYHYFLFIFNLSLCKFYSIMS
jgi:hypothetical protein